MSTRVSRGREGKRGRSSSHACVADDTDCSHQQHTICLSNREIIMYASDAEKGWSKYAGMDECMHAWIALIVYVCCE